MAQITIDDDTQAGLQKIAKRNGMNVSVFLKSFVINNEQKRKVLTENGFTPEEEDEILQSAEEAKMGINCSPTLEGDDAIEYLRSLSKK